MKAVLKSFFLLPMLMAGFGLMLPAETMAQTFRGLYSFGESNGVANPSCSLVLSGNKLYGTAVGVGSGAVFAINKDGTGFTNLYSFSAVSGSDQTNSDGAIPYAGLILLESTLYGTAVSGGIAGDGTVFAISIGGSDFTNLHNFDFYVDGMNPMGVLVFDGSKLYGTTVNGTGPGSGDGTVFAMNTDGTGFTNLHRFGWPPADSPPNSDGASPNAGLLLSGNTLYGTASGGGAGRAGTVFALNTDGSGFTNLHSFTTPVDQVGGPQTNIDGAYPLASLTISGNTLYGTCNGGSAGVGSVFKIGTDGSGFTTLHSFSFNEGIEPRGGLIISSSTLYGTTIGGGSGGGGTVFALNTDGSGFTILHNFTSAFGGSRTNRTNQVSEGASPEAGVILAGYHLYGTASSGGSSSNGIIYSISLLPRLGMTRSGTNIVLTWPTNYAGFDYTGFSLQSSTNPFSAAWTTNYPLPVVVNGQNTVTNPVTGSQQFFRLSQ